MSRKEKGFATQWLRTLFHVVLMTGIQPLIRF